MLALVLVGVLFYLHFSSARPAEKAGVMHNHHDSTAFRIAYFDIDSLQAKYEYFKDISGELKTREAINHLTAQFPAGHLSEEDEGTANQGTYHEPV